MQHAHWSRPRSCFVRLLNGSAGYENAALQGGRRDSPPTSSSPSSSSVWPRSRARPVRAQARRRDGPCPPAVPGPTHTPRRPPIPKQKRPRPRRELGGVQEARARLLKTMLAAPSAREAWAAYQDLVSGPAPSDEPPATPVVPHRHLHRLARLLASTKPRTRTLYLQLSSVLTALRKTGGDVYTWEWNALIDCVGKHWRKTDMMDYKAALDVFYDMNPSGDSISHDHPDRRDDTPCTPSKHSTPDIITYTTLLSIAGRSKQPSAIRHALKLLRTSGLASNRVTHLTVLNCFARAGQLAGVRSTLRKMGEQRMDVGIDGANACIWVYARCGRMEVASMIYRVLRSHCAPRSRCQAGALGEDDVAAAARYLREVEHLDVPRGLVPDEVTYTSVIQCLAYQGDLVQALNVFVDMLACPGDGAGAGAGKRKRYRPSMAVFRAIFLGFYRHSRSADDAKGTTTDPPEGSSAQSPWNLENLELVFVAFMDLPKEAAPSERLLYWILVAFGRTSGREPGKLRRVWEQLEDKYGGGWGGRLERLRRAIYASRVADED